MTLFKLSLRNARRQARDYMVYFVTVVLAAALLYSFNGLIFSREINTLSQTMEMLPVLIALADIVVLCVFGWLVAYATQTFIPNIWLRAAGPPMAAVISWWFRMKPCRV